MLPLIAGLGPGEIALILAVLVLLFGASKLPELARGSGRALRIFKAETKGLLDDDDDPDSSTPGSTSASQRELQSGPGSAGSPGVPGSPGGSVGNVGSEDRAAQPQPERRDDTA